MSAIEVVSVAVDMSRMPLGLINRGGTAKQKAATLGRILAFRDYPHLRLGKAVHVELDAIGPGVAEVLVEVLPND